MNAKQRALLRRLQGCTVHMALADGSRIDDAVLMSAGSRTVWVFLNGEDTFIAVRDVTDVWETRRLRSAA